MRAMGGGGGGGRCRTADVIVGKGRFPSFHFKLGLIFNATNFVCFFTTLLSCLSEVRYPAIKVPSFCHNTAARNESILTQPAYHHYDAVTIAFYFAAKNGKARRPKLAPFTTHEKERFRDMCGFFSSLLLFFFFWFCLTGVVTPAGRNGFPS